MISAETIAALEAQRLLYILGVRERSDKLLRELAARAALPSVSVSMSDAGTAANSCLSDAFRATTSLYFEGGRAIDRLRRRVAIATRPT
jgi:hypothetical protein